MRPGSTKFQSLMEERDREEMALTQPPRKDARRSFFARSDFWTSFFARPIRDANLLLVVVVTFRQRKFQTSLKVALSKPCHDERPDGNAVRVVLWLEVSQAFARGRPGSACFELCEGSTFEESQAVMGGKES